MIQYDYSKVASEVALHLKKHNWSFKVSEMAFLL